MKKTKLFFITSLTSTISTLPLIVTSCEGDNKMSEEKPNPSDKPNQKTKPSQKPYEKSHNSTLEGTINYIAIGDSVAAGYNAYKYRDQGGYLFPNKTIKGDSYPSVIARSIMNMNDSTTKLASFANYAITGSTVDDWIYLLKSSEITDADDLDKIKKRIDKALAFNKMHSDIDNINGKSRLEFLFDNFTFKNGIIPAFHNFVKKSNLMTISLGGNDLRKFVNIEGVVKNALTNRNLFAQDKLEIFNMIKDGFKRLKDHLEKRYSILIDIIKQINPKININIISYPVADLSLAKKINTYYKDVTPDIVSYFVNSLNEINMSIAKNKNINYFNSFDRTYWTENIHDFRSDDILHPTNNGYKKMGKDVFLKMVVNSNAGTYSSGLDKSYWDSDTSNHYQVINFPNLSNKEIIDKQK